jgi:predicted kinase
VKNLSLVKTIRDAQPLLRSLGLLPKPVERPVFIALSGLPGTGKTFFSQQLAAKLPLAILESDALRKVLFPEPTYSLRESARLFRACYFLIEELLQMRISLILDATNLEERYRKQLYNIAKRVGVQFILVKVEAPRETVKKRLAVRESDTLNNSDADWEIYKSMERRAEKIRLKHYTVDTTKDIGPFINKILREINEEGD